MLRLPDGTVKVLVEGKMRVEIRSFTSADPYFAVEINELPDQAADSPEAEALVRSIHTTFDSYAKLNKKIAPEIVNSISAITDPGKLSDTVIAHLNLKLPDRQKLLEVTSTVDRLEEVFSSMQAEIEVLEVEGKIRGRVKTQMERSQKEYYLNEQMRAIQKELGDRDEQKNEIGELEEALAAKQMPDEARDRTEKEIKNSEKPELDRWIISELHSLINEVDCHFSKYEPTKATRSISKFVQLYLSNWYVRLSRRRFWKGSYEVDKISAYQTLFTCLIEIAKISSPIAPFFMDRLYCDLISNTKFESFNSVHHTTFPISNSELIDLELQKKIRKAQIICSLVLSLRKKEKIKVRQPLSKVMIPYSNLDEKIEIE